MSTNFPTSLDTLTNPTSSDKLNSPDHAAQHASENDAIEALEAKVGVNNSAVTTSLDYIIKNAASNGGGHVQTANKGGTGQTSYTKGDLLVAQSASVIAKLAIGVDNQALIVNSSTASGVQWGNPILPPTVTVHSVGGVGGGASSYVALWRKPSTLTYAVVEVVGGGGGGGGTTTVNYGAAGGGGGGYAKKVVTYANLPLAASIIIGQGGGGGVGTGGSGSGAATTYFGSVLYATGGAGGTETDEGGAGGQGVGGDVNVYGSGGGGGNTNGAAGGTGGSSPLGGGGRGRGNDAAGLPGSVLGGGGAGARSSGSDRAGGSGAPGGVIIYEY